MKLSLAIRVGAMIRPQGFRGLFTSDGSCALGAALEAMGAQYNVDYAACFDDSYVYYSKWPWLLGASAHCPECFIFDTQVVVITHLNDTHRYTREAIADWVQSIEPQDPQAVTPEPQEQPCSAAK